MMEGSISSRGLVVESNQVGDPLSAEDIAWVDSCLIRDPEISESNWNSLKGALLEIFSSQTEFPDSSYETRESAFHGMEILPSSEEAETSHRLENGIASDVSVYESEGYPETSESNWNSLKGDTSETRRDGFPGEIDLDILHSEDATTSQDLRNSVIKVVPSHETRDLAWLDSYPELSDGNWNPPTDDLLEIFSSKLVSANSSKTRRYGFPTETNIELLQLSEEAEASHHDIGIADVVSINERDENDDYVTLEKTDDLNSSTVPLDALLPSYNEDLKEFENADLDDLDFSVLATEPLTDDIFRVWDMGFQAEDDEFIKQLNKALAESSAEQEAKSSAEQEPSTFDKSQLWKDLNEESLDELISGIAGLSLKPDSF